jgi:outer membrane protein OmpA-like peptidoglycan-associated protein
MDARLTPGRWRRGVSCGVGLVLGLAVVLSGACVRVKPAKVVANDPEFRAKTDELFRAYSALNVEQIMSFYAPDTYSLSFDLPYKFDTGAGPHRERLERFLARVTSIKVTPGPNLEVWRDEDRVWTTRTFELEGTLKNNDTFRFDGEFSAIWEKRGKGWAIVYEHFWGPAQVAKAPTPPPLPPPPPPPPVVPPLTDDKFADIYFDFDKWNIRTDQIPTLTANALLLKQYPTAVVVIEGHCDERGSLGYNRVLGQRRADATMKYMESLGIEASRMQAVSEGKERPFVTGRGEKVWSRNRRSHFVVVKK